MKECQALSNKGLELSINPKRVYEKVLKPTAKKEVFLNMPA